MYIKRIYIQIVKFVLLKGTCIYIEFFKIYYLTDLNHILNLPNLKLNKFISLWCLLIDQ